MGTVSMFDVSLLPGPSAFLPALLPARATAMAQDRQLSELWLVSHTGDMIQTELMRGPKEVLTGCLPRSRPAPLTRQAEARASPWLESQLLGGSRLELLGTARLSPPQPAP